MNWNTTFFLAKKYIYVLSANSGSIIIVVGLELMRMTSCPSSFMALHARVPKLITFTGLAYDNRLNPQYHDFLQMCALPTCGYMTPPLLNEGAILFLHHEASSPIFVAVSVSNLFIFYAGKAYERAKQATRIKQRGDDRLQSVGQVMFSRGTRSKQCNDHRFKLSTTSEHQYLCRV